jgi:hypothetical protein
MSNKIDQLLNKFESVINEPWTGTLSGQEKVMFLVYDPNDQRKIDFRLPDFERVTRKVGKKWAEISIKSCFPEWMAIHDFREEYFLEPELIEDQLESDLKEYTINFIRSKIIEIKADPSTLIVIRDVSALFGLVRLSHILNGIDLSYEGRLLIFFPGEFDKNHYRLLDARDGWSYLARPITL